MKKFKRKVLDMLMSNNSGSSLRQQLLDSAPFRSSLLYTAVPQRAASGTTGTFTRATTSTWKNNDGYMVTGVAGEIGFPGARRVRNLLTFTEDLSNAAWSKGGTFTSPTITTGVADPLGTTRACTITAVGGDGVVYQAITPPAATGYVAVNSAWIRRRTGTGAVYLRTANNVDVNIASTLTTEWQRFSSVAAGPAAGSWYFVIGVGVAGDAIDVAFCQCEDVTAQTTQTAGEYVSVGVPSSWAGTEFLTNGTFDTDTTGWTAAEIFAGALPTLAVSSGKLRITNTGATYGCAHQTFTTVIGAKYVFSADFTLGTCGSGSCRIGSTGFPTYDLAAAPFAATGKFTAEFTATTTSTTVTLVNLNNSGGYNEFDNVSVKPAYYHGSFVDGIKCFATDISGNPIPLTTLLGYQAQGARTNLCLQSQDLTTTWGNVGSTETANVIVAPDGTTTADKIVESAVNSTHTVYQTFAGTSGVYTSSVYLKAAERTWAYITEGNSVTATAYFDLANGVVGTISGTGSPTAKIVSAGNGWYRCSMTFTAGANANIQIATSTGDTQSSFLGDITKGVYAWGAQFELGSFASSYIPTTTIAVARNADVLTYPSAGNVSGTVGAAYCEIKTGSACGRALSFNAGGTGMIDAETGDSLSFRAYDETNVVNVTAGDSSASTVKQAIAWGGSTLSAARNGTTASGSFDGNMSPTGISIGGTTGGELNGTIRNVRIWSRQLSASELGAITA